MNRSPQTSDQRVRPARQAPLAVALAALLTTMLISGCGRSGPPLQEDYGHRRGETSAKSVNGTFVLARMFEKRDWDVTSWRRMSPKLKEADVIVWAPDSYLPPSEEQTKWFSRWLDDQPYGRTLIFIGRDYDAAVEYWERFAATASPEDQAWVEKELERAKYEQTSDLRTMNDPTSSRWFIYRKREKPVEVEKIDANSYWSEMFDPAKAEITLGNELIPPGPVTPENALLVDADGNFIAYRVWHNNNQVIVVANGSFLLNYALINVEHRKLAGALIDACDEASYGDRVVFLEGAPYQIQIYDQEPDDGQPSGFTMLTIWPLGYLLIHLLVLGSIVCFIAYPVFGRAKRLKNLGLSDFGKHIEALGDLIAETKNRQYASERLTYYEEHVRRESRDN